MLEYRLDQHTIDIAYEALELSKQAGDLRQIAFSWFQLGFTLLAGLMKLKKASAFLKIIGPILSR